MPESTAPSRIAVLTSGGDAPGMNAAVRAVVRTGLAAGVEVNLVYEGYRGLVDGGAAIVPATSADVGGILQQGGTAIGTARSEAFRTRDGRRQAARNLVERGIDALIVIGGDGSLTGADTFRTEWPELLAELVEEGDIDEDTAAAHPHLRLVGMVGSIDNDMFGTDMTIGADTALHRITEAIDALHATASSHQRSFVIEVMGRNCGYLALMSGLATGANWIFVPERPPNTDDWARSLSRTVEAGRRVGRRQNIVVIAEGAHDWQGEPITADQVKEALEQGLGEDTRVTILGHVQRGGAASAFDRNLGTRCGHRAVHELLALGPDEPAKLVGIRENRITTSDLLEAIERTHAVADLIQQKRYEEAMELRGGSFVESHATLRTLVRAQPRPPEEGERAGKRPLRIAVLHGGGPAPGMNTAVRAAVRIGLDSGHEMLRVDRGFKGLRDGRVEPFGWMSVSGWVSRGGAELGTRRWVPDEADVARIAEQIAEHRIDGLLMIGGLTGYLASHALQAARDIHPALDLPIVCLPATINNDLPGTDLTVGTDTALNAIVSDVDKIKRSAVASRRCFVVEVMGKDSGYLGLTSALATGAERVYLPERGITLRQLHDDVDALSAAFDEGQQLGLLIRSENADPVYTTEFVRSVFEKESGDHFDARASILGHLQQGGDPSPFDRIQATRLAVRCVGHLIEAIEAGDTAGAMIGLQRGRVAFTPLDQLTELLAEDADRPAEQPWLDDLLPIAEAMSVPGVD
ncbi:6-phosphofructokinase [Nitriliruptor alkaliphilus]|uniref:6-phosphofructokinase n=1 Tax=Nitriliruptor alkaliphilus TaxID=427918 RepID=UPI000A411F74|nr:6-phosphofructokinase [Nitriliruptor alkaliphilus]